jgi:putative addiction module component (TIGR02574 family)
MISQPVDSIEEILRRAMSLSADDRVRLAEMLLESLEGNDKANDSTHPDLHPAWEAEIKRRLAKIDAGEAVMVSWEEVDRKAQEILDRAANRQISG